VNWRDCGEEESRWRGKGDKHRIKSEREKRMREMGREKALR
jgi:hypothetical protein